MALKGNQKKLDKNNNNRIDAQDFKILKAEKAKDRGMGLQDEKVKPGKVIKAKRGTGILSEKGTSKNFKGYSKVFEGPQNKGRVATISGVKPTLPKPSKESSLARRALRGVKATSLGKRLLPVVAAGVAAQQYLKSKMKKKKEEPKKKMGGGMMKRPMGYKKGKEIDYGKIFDKKFYKSALGKEAQLHADDYDAGLDRAERRAASETMALMKKNKKMGGGMMKVKGYSIGSPRTPEERRRSRGPQEAKKSGRAGLGALGGSGNKSETINLMKNKIYKYKAKKDSGFTDKQVSMQKDIKEKSYKRKSGEKRLGKIFDASPTILSKAGMTGSKRAGMPGFSIMTTSSKGKTKLNYARPYGGTIETGFRGYDERTPGMGLKTGKSIKVKCKLGKNKPTKMY